MAREQYFLDGTNEQASGRIKELSPWRGRIASTAFLALFLSLCPVAKADETPAAKPHSSTKSSRAAVPKSSSSQISLDALLREEEEMRRREEEMLRKAVSKAANSLNNPTSPPATAVNTSRPTTVKPAEATTTKPQVQRARQKRPLPQPSATASPEPTLAKLKNTKAADTSTPLPTKTFPPIETAEAAPPKAAATPTPKPTASPQSALEATKPVAPVPSKASGKAAASASPAQPPTGAAKGGDAPTGLLREQLTALTLRNRQLEAELETLRSHLAISETEVERLNDFLNEQGREYLNRATGGTSPTGRNPAPPRLQGERSSGRSNRPAPGASSQSGGLQRSPFEPARSLETDQTVSIASVVSSSAVGREGPSSSAAVIDRIPAGSQVTVEREAQGWYRVLTPLGIRVWVSAKDLAFGADGSVPPIRRDQSSSILPPDEQAPSPEDQLAAAEISPEDRAVELLKQSMGGSSQ